jgi:3'(2'), 5'-bisphosphate nucleotidase
MGSALKFALLAVGEAELYPRFGATSEWDTAAGQALLEATGGGLWDLATQKRLGYLKADWENRGGFLALRGGDRAEEVVAEASRLKRERDRSQKEKA